MIWHNHQTDTNEFLKRIASDHPHFALLTNDYIDTLDFLTNIRLTSPDTRIIVCVLPNFILTNNVWKVVDKLALDMLCTLSELTDCLILLQKNQFYRSALMTIHPAFASKEAFPGWHSLSIAERRVLKQSISGYTSPKIADILFISHKTVDNHKAKISQKLNISGGPGSLIRFVLLNREKLKQLLD